ncbi:MAG: hypothetical protein Ta2B_05610 [Termitinemataceae bacterium]|nr:MAG: hypothetical protein Ta2B_05610 [Termitinemataceae bacterium]
MPQITKTPQEATDLSSKKQGDKPPSLKRDKTFKIFLFGIIGLVVLAVFFENMSTKKKKEAEQSKEADIAFVPQDIASNYKDSLDKKPAVTTQTTQLQDNNTAVTSTQEFERQQESMDNFRRRTSSQENNVQPPDVPYTMEHGYEEPYTADYKPENDPLVMAQNSRMQPVMDGNIFPAAVSGGQSGVPQTSTPGQNSGLSDYYNAMLASRQNMPGAAGAPPTPYEAQNMQGNKEAFSAKPDGTNTISGSYVMPDTLWSGTVIPAVLITGINTDIPGDVTARVTANVYDSQTGKHLLIPQGSIVTASYNSSVSYAQSRIQIVWNTLTRPDGYQLDLGGMNGVDDAGFSGQKGKYDEKWFQYAKAAAIISMFTIANGELTRQAGAAGANFSGDIAAANQQLVTQMSGNIINKALDIQPTISLKNGTKINVMLNKNVYLTPVKEIPVSEKYRLE